MQAVTKLSSKVFNMSFTLFHTGMNCWSFRFKMTDVDRLDLLARIGMCFKIGAEGSFGVATQGKGCFLCSTNRIWQKPYLSDVCSCKEFFKFRATADRHCYLTWLKKRSVRNTRLLPHANMPLVPMNCFLCRVDYALEENVLTEQMWILAAY